ncbi:conserved hypothetical protein [Hyella patelloides LEGE 07179]|uniref:DUF3493 domain-containing protein n=1 Tax=Hyella patelloides LEGE 07179 TaxID=945734 RepID=A0A563VVQ5_9CYAN|nr:DUF3493 domain-containing protein [Hyella patelloides]VEP15485.1 conserved hypothetical protein [Hyella patelloides LEGE 07179]
MVDFSDRDKMRQQKAKISPEKYARLKAEAKAPYRGLRKFLYIGFGASGFIGALTFLARIAAGQDLARDVPNFALQVGVVALMIFFFRLDRKKEKK